MMTSVDARWERAQRQSPAAKAVVDVARATDGVVGVLFHGSRVIGLDHRLSDIDLTIAVKDDTAGAVLRDAIAAVTQYDASFVDYFDDAPVEFWSDGQIELGIHIYTVETLARRFHVADASIAQFEASAPWMQHVFMESHALDDPHGLMRAYRLRAALPDPNNFVSLADLYLQRIGQKITWWDVRPSWKTSNEQLGDVAVILDELTRAHYAVNDRYYMPGGKNYQADLQWLQPDLQQVHFDLLSFDPRSPNSGYVKDAVREAYYELTAVRRRNKLAAPEDAARSALSYAESLATPIDEVSTQSLQARRQLAIGDRWERNGRRDCSHRDWAEALSLAALEGDVETGARAASRLGFPVAEQNLRVTSFSRSDQSGMSRSGADGRGW